MWGTLGLKYKEKEQHGKGEGSQCPSFLSVIYGPDRPIKAKYEE